MLSDDRHSICVVCVWLGRRLSRVAWLHVVVVLLLVAALLSVIYEVSPGGSKQFLEPLQPGVRHSPQDSHRLSEEQRLILNQRAAIFQDQMSSLKLQINVLEEELSAIKIKPKVSHIDPKSRGYLAIDRSANVMRTNSHAMVSPARLNDPLEVIPYSWYNKSHLLSSTTSLEQLNLVELTAQSRLDLDEASSLANRQHNKTGSLRLLGGIVRDIPRAGRQYQLLYDNYDADDLNKTAIAAVILMPHRALETIEVTRLNQRPHFLVVFTVERRPPNVDSFVTRFFRTALKSIHSDRIHLSLVHFGADGFSAWTDLLDAASHAVNNAVSFSIIPANDSQTTSSKVEYAIREWKSTRARDVVNNTLLVLSRNDVTWKSSFYDRCVQHVTAGATVYYPIVFTLFNPHFVYTRIHREHIPTTENQLRVDGNKGLWQVFFFDVSCQFLLDYELVSRSRTAPDVTVPMHMDYRRSGYRVVRVPDPAVFQMWHERRCFRVPREQFGECLTEKILSAGSHTQLGFIAFNVTQGSKRNSHL